MKNTTIKKLLSLFLAIAIMICVVPFGAFTLTASAESEEYTEDYYIYTVSNEMATITEVNTSISGDVTIPSKLGGYPVTSIGDAAFANCNRLTNITIPNSVTIIGDRAFYFCYDITSIAIPDSVTYIGNDAFIECINLKSIAIPNGVKNIAGSTFYGCRNLTKITIPDSVNFIGEFAFDSCSSLKSITIPSSVKFIDEKAFKDCSNLEKVYYKGSKADKQEILIGANFYLSNATWYYNSCTDSKSHDYQTTTTKATLAKNGKVVKKCKVCSKVASTTTIKYVKSFKLSTTSYTYNGKVKTPSVTVKDSAGKTLKKNTDYTVSYASGRKSVGTYKVTIKMKGKYSGTKTLTFKINPVKTSVSKLTAGKKSITVNISKKSTQVSGYQVQYSTSKKFTSAKTKTISSYKTTKYTLKSLSAKKTYYVRVRTYKTVNGKKYYSGWSTVKSVKTK